MAPSSSAVAENEMTKPSAIIAGRRCELRPIEAPSRIGSIGSVHGAAMVRMPARAAKRSSSMGHSWRGSRGQFGMSEAVVTPRHAFVTGVLLPQLSAPNTKRPGGGHPVRVVGGLGRFNETVCELYRREVFPPDVVLCFNCFVGGNTSVSRTGSKPAPYPLEISELQAAKRSTPQPLSNSASCLRA